MLDYLFNITDILAGLRSAQMYGGHFISTSILHMECYHDPQQGNLCTDLMMTTRVWWIVGWWFQLLYETKTTVEPPNKGHFGDNILYIRKFS